MSGLGTDGLGRSEHDGEMPADLRKQRFDDGLAEELRDSSWADGRRYLGEQVRGGIAWVRAMRAGQPPYWWSVAYDDAAEPLLERPFGPDPTPVVRRVPLRVELRTTTADDDLTVLLGGHVVGRLVTEEYAAGPFPRPVAGARAARLTRRGTAPRFLLEVALHDPPPA